MEFRALEWNFHTFDIVEPRYLQGVYILFPCDVRTLSLQNLRITKLQNFQILESQEFTTLENFAISGSVLEPENSRCLEHRWSVNSDYLVQG